MFLICLSYLFPYKIYLLGRQLFFSPKCMLLVHMPFLHFCHQINFKKIYLAL
jgi:hypothetical protein